MKLEVEKPPDENKGTETEQPEAATTYEIHEEFFPMCGSIFCIWSFEYFFLQIQCYGHSWTFEHEFFHFREKPVSRQTFKSGDIWNFDEEKLLQWAFDDSKWSKLAKEISEERAAKDEENKNPQMKR